MRPHTAGSQDSLKDPSVVEPPGPEPSREPRPPGSDPVPAAILLPGQGVVKGRVSGCSPRSLLSVRTHERRVRRRRVSGKPAGVPTPPSARGGPALMSLRGAVTGAGRRRTQTTGGAAAVQHDLVAPN